MESADSYCVYSREAQEFLDARENTVAGGTAWERIGKLVDLSDKGARAGKSDKARFREMLISLRKDEKVHNGRAPGFGRFDANFDPGPRCERSLEAVMHG